MTVPFLTPLILKKADTYSDAAKPQAQKSPPQRAGTKRLGIVNTLNAWKSQENWA
jgi:hypothetical protein